MCIYSSFAHRRVLPCSATPSAAWPSLPLWRRSAVCVPARSSVRGWHLHTARGQRSEVNSRLWGRAVVLGQGSARKACREWTSGRGSSVHRLHPDVSVCVCVASCPVVMMSHCACVWTIKTLWCHRWCLTLPFALTCPCTNVPIQQKHNCILSTQNMTVCGIINHGMLYGLIVIFAGNSMKKEC